MKPTIRTYQTEADYWHIREFLRQVFLLNDRHEYSWSLLRWDYWVWHVNMNIFHFNLDDVTNTAVFEPVGTHPAHQKRGLGKAVMSEGLRRAQKLGATPATVSSYSTGAHALYDSMGFTEVDLLEPWFREWS